MSRPAPIAALDAALEEHLARLPEAEAEQARVVAEHADAIAAVEAAQQARMDAFYGAKSIEQSIRKLGYVVLGPNGKGTVSRDASRLDGHSGTFRVPTTDPTTTTQQGDQPT